MLQRSFGARHLLVCNQLKRTETVPIKGCRSLSSLASDPNFLQNVKAAKTSLSPNEHTENQAGMWYSVPPETAHRLYNHHGLNKYYRDICNTLRETSFLIRDPALSIIDYIKRSNLENVPNKYVLYGRKGQGKSLTLSHVMHYLDTEGWIIAHVHSPATLCRGYNEIVPSLSRPEHFDHTIDASKYLQHFLSQNMQKLKNLKLTTYNDYKWNVRESTPKGSSLLDVVEFGIQRAKYASEAVFCLNSELKLNANEGRCKVGVVFDGINVMFQPTSLFLREDRTVVPVKLFTFFQAFRQFLQHDWKNGCFVSALNLEMTTPDRRKSILPRYLLRKEGWETLDPFVPIHVDRFDDHEINCFINYYAENKWLQHSEATSPDGREELKYLSAGNGSDLLTMINSR